MKRGKDNNYVLIMAGGVGSRFWPKSRKSFPKQFIDILGTGQSLLQMTYSRFEKICSQEQIYILTNQDYLGLVLEQINGISLENILLEPSRNNTAPCIAYACYKILKKNPDANIVVAPSDHLILKEEEFLNRISQALTYTSNNDALLTLGISPTRPDTGYGYIKFEYKGKIGVHKVERFLEKPVVEEARQYVQSGDYLWNAGIFIWSAQSIQNAFKKYAPEIHDLFEMGQSVYNTIGEIDFINENYSLSPKISIDYAILEKASNVYTIPADIGWSDLGTWASLYDVADKDDDCNVSNTDIFFAEESEGCIVHGIKGKAIVVKGLKDFIVVDDRDVLLIYPKKDEQQIKQITTKIAEEMGEQFV